MDSLCVCFETQEVVLMEEEEPYALSLLASELVIFSFNTSPNLSHTAFSRNIST
jgi:hypothetical protein